MLFHTTSFVVVVVVVVVAIAVPTLAIDAGVKIDLGGRGDGGDGGGGRPGGRGGADGGGDGGGDGGDVSSSFTPCHKKPSLPLTKIGSGRYYIETKNTESWYGALKFCKRHGLELLTTGSKQENDAILAHLKSKKLDQEHATFWTGGRAQGGFGGDFFWTATGRTIEESGFSYWLTGEPSKMYKGPKGEGIELRNFQTGKVDKFTLSTTDADPENCIAMWSSPHAAQKNRVLGWNDMYCTSKAYFICEKRSC